MGHEEFLFAAFYDHILKDAEFALDHRDDLIQEVVVVASEDEDLCTMLLHNLHHCLEEVGVLEGPERIALLLELPSVDGVTVEDEPFRIYFSQEIDGMRHFREPCPNMDIGQYEGLIFFLFSHKNIFTLSRLQRLDSAGTTGTKRKDSDFLVIYNLLEGYTKFESQVIYACDIVVAVMVGSVTVVSCNLET